MVRLIFLCWIFCQQTTWTQNFKDGDIIFQSSLSQQSKAVEEATNSPFSHCGIIFYEKGEAFVYEAVQPVGKRKLSDWIESGVSQKYVVMRLMDSSSLTKDNLEKMKLFAKNQFGRNYDIYFGWSDKEWYCSELVWKTYYNILSIELAKPKALKEFNIDAPIVRKTMAKRYGNNIPYDEKMISPGQIFDSKFLYQVK
ncbi:MAG: YiiX family permuted papain-like enzyme [Crocinitomicaceae bacterium]